MESELQRLRQKKDAAYDERMHLVAAMARLFPSGLRETDTPGWTPDWKGCVYIDLPTGQISYHYHTRHAALFDGLPAYDKPWDGHTKAEVHNRLAALYAEPDQASRVLPAEGSRYEVVETPGVGWAIYDPWGELVVFFDDANEARQYARQLNNPEVRRKPILRLVADTSSRNGVDDPQA